jgi:MFS superfamily sulfate permease-like transporter
MSLRCDRGGVGDPVGGGVCGGRGGLAGEGALRAPASGGGVAFLGSSRQLAIGPEGSLATLVAAALLLLAVAGSADAAGLAAMLALLVGVCFAAAWVLRLGWIADCFSRPVRCSGCGV